MFRSQALPSGAPYALSFLSVHVNAITAVRDVSGILSRIVDRRGTSFIFQRVYDLKCCVVP